MANFPAKVNFKFQAPVKKEEEHKESMMCAVYGCPRIGTITQDSRRNCRYHWNRSGDVLHHITLVLKNHEFLFNWYEKLTTLNVVDFDDNWVGQHSPVTHRVEPSESWLDYKERIKGELYVLLKINEFKGRKCSI